MGKLIPEDTELAERMAICCQLIGKEEFYGLFNEVSALLEHIRRENSLKEVPLFSKRMILTCRIVEMLSATMLSIQSETVKDRIFWARIRSIWARK